MPAQHTRGLLFAEAFAWFALAGGMWLYAYRYDGDFPAYLWGPVAWPRAIILAIVVLATLHLLVELARSRRGNAPPRRDLEAGPAGDDEDQGPGAQVRVVAAFVLPLLYLLLLPRTGYFATTPVFLVAYMLAFREQSWRYMLFTTALLYLGSLLIFSKLLFVPLPTGSWPGFYDFSNWLLEFLHALW